MQVPRTGLQQLAALCRRCFGPSNPLRGATLGIEREIRCHDHWHGIMRRIAKMELEVQREPAVKSGLFILQNERQGIIPQCFIHSPTDH